VAELCPPIHFDIIGLFRLLRFLPTFHATFAGAVAGKRLPRFPRKLKELNDLITGSGAYPYTPPARGLGEVVEASLSLRISSQNVKGGPFLPDGILNSDLGPPAGFNKQMFGAK
jgi:hypothetical protein